MFPIMNTPCLVLDIEKLEANILAMAQFADAKGLDLRPHAKAHKLVPVAQMQIKAGAKGLTVSKLGEMETFLAAGIDDIFLAYQLVSEQNIIRLLDAAKHAQIKVAVDNPYQVRLLGELAKRFKVDVETLIEIDTGLARCGVTEIEQAATLAQEINRFSGLKLKGIMTHAGQVYAADSVEKVAFIGRREGEVMANMADDMRCAGYDIDVVSVGSTPTAKIAGSVQGVTEIRPGNYVFYDAMQVGLGVVAQECCALTVCTTIISKSADGLRLVVDAGSKTLALDKGAHGVELVKGYGIIKGFPNLTLERLSEEHGVIVVNGDGNVPDLGEVLEVIPNHACPVVNLAEQINVLRDGQLIDIWPVDARGKVQ